MSAATAAILLLGAPIAYAACCTAFLLFVRFSDDRPLTVLEDLGLMLAIPFIVVLLGATVLRRRR